MSESTKLEVLYHSRGEYVRLDAYIALQSEYANVCKFATQYEQERDELRQQLQFTNSNWPHEKKLHEQLATITLDRDQLLEEVEIFKDIVRACSCGTGSK